MSDLRHVLRRQALQEQEVIDDARFGCDGLAAQIFDRVDALVDDDGVVARGVVVHQHDHLVTTRRDAEHGVVQGLTVAVDLACDHGIERRDVVGEVLHLDVHTVRLEEPLLIGDGPGEPAGPRAVAERDLVAACRAPGRRPGRTAGCGRGVGRRGRAVRAARRREQQEEHEDERHGPTRDAGGVRGFAHCRWAPCGWATRIARGDARTVRHELSARMSIEIRDGYRVLDEVLTGAASRRQLSRVSALRMITGSRRRSRSNPESVISARNVPISRGV